MSRSLRDAVPSPRLLPLTAICMAALLVLKSVSFVRAAAPAAPPAPASTVPASTVPASPALASPAMMPKPGGANPGAPNSAAPNSASPNPGTTNPGTPKPPQAGAAPLVGAVPPPSPSAQPPVSESERALLLDLRQRRQELEAREQEAAAREALLKAAEQRIGQRVEELKALQSRLEALEAGRRDRDEAGWRSLVKVYETMKPRDAANIMNDLDLPVLLGVLDRMKEAKAAAVLAAMQPERARQVTAELAQQRQRANAPARPSSPPPRG